MVRRHAAGGVPDACAHHLVAADFMSFRCSPHEKAPLGFMPASYIISMQRIRRTLVILIIVAATLGGVLALGRTIAASDAVPYVFSPTTMLDVLWTRYKESYVSEDGRTTDWEQRGGVTTSEAQSYTMLRAVWVDDKETFDAAWQWTQEHLQVRPNDHLFAWLYGARNDGTEGILVSEGGMNTASDADTDIALALVYAGSRWGDEKYFIEAYQIIDDIWEHEVVIVAGKPYLAAHTVAPTPNVRHVILNPSYFAPYAYRAFAPVDPRHQWMGLVDTSYEVLQESSTMTLAGEEGAGLPPNWIFLDLRTAELSAVETVLPNEPEGRSAYGYDAMRIPWRLTLDARWHNEERARSVMRQMRPLSEYWGIHGWIPAVFTHDGEAFERKEVPAAYGGAIGYFLIVQPSLAEAVFENKLRSLYAPEFGAWRDHLGYFGENWAWFGMALYYDAVPNLARLNDGPSIPPNRLPQPDPVEQAGGAEQLLYLLNASASAP